MRRLFHPASCLPARSCWRLVGSDLLCDECDVGMLDHDGLYARSPGSTLFRWARRTTLSGRSAICRASPSLVVSRELAETLHMADQVSALANGRFAAQDVKGGPK